MACVTYGLAVPSGLFVPSLLSGAALGAFVRMCVVAHIHQCMLELIVSFVRCCVLLSGTLQPTCACRPSSFTHYARTLARTYRPSDGAYAAQVGQLFGYIRRQRDICPRRCCCWVGWYGKNDNFPRGKWDQMACVRCSKVTSQPAMPLTSNNTHDTQQGHLVRGNWRHAVCVATHACTNGSTICRQYGAPVCSHTPTCTPTCTQTHTHTHTPTHTSTYPHAHVA